MNQIMISTFSGVFIAVFFYGIYCYVRNNKFFLIKVVLTVYLFLAFLPLINMLRSEEFDIFGIFVQLLTIILIFCIIFSIYKKDIQFEELYKTISSIGIKPIIVLGISNIGLNDIEYFNGKIKNISNAFCRLKKNMLVIFATIMKY